MDEDSATLFLVHLIMAFRRRLAPAGSLRERILRLVTLPLLRGLIRKSRSRVGPNPQTVQRRALTTATQSLPAQPTILIIKQDNVGDFIVAMRAMEHLRAGFSDAVITLICNNALVELAKKMNIFDLVFGFDFFSSAGIVDTEWERKFKTIPLTNYDIVIDLRHDADTRKMLYIVDARFRAGFCAPQNAGGDILDIALPDVEHISVENGSGRPLHAEQRLLLLAGAVTSLFLNNSHPALRLASQKIERDRNDKSYAILAPGAGQSIRVWPVDRLIEVGRILIERYHMDIVVVGGPAEQTLGILIVQALPHGRVRNLVGCCPLEELPNVMNDACLYVGCDTGPTHLAAALGIPTVSILSGVPNAEVWGTAGNNVVIVAGRTTCSPCHLTRSEQCPFGVACLDVIKIEDVISACEKLLKNDL